jgi:hypothetical protein
MNRKPSSRLRLRSLTTAFLLVIASVLHVHAQDDTTAPLLVGFGLSPQQVDTGSAAANVTFSAHVTDDLSGTVNVSVYTVSPSGKIGQQGSAYVPASGSALDGTFQVLIGFPMYSELGTWTVYHVAVYDKVGNYRGYDVPQLQAAGFPTTFVVTGTQDTTAPVLLGFGLFPQQVDTSSAAANVTFSAHVTDDISGVSEVYVDTVSASGKQGQYFSSGVPVSGDALDGNFQVVLNYPVHSELGTWTVAYVTLHDKAGNYRMYYTADLQAAGFPTTFVITGIQDTTPPTLLGFGLTTGGYQFCCS